MTGFWSSETLKKRLPSLIKPYSEDRVGNCSYELSMGNQACITNTDEPKVSSLVKLDRGLRLHIPPGQFAQLLIHEWIEIPEDALGLISMKSGLKMRGLVNVSGFHVDPGYQGKLVFAVFNAGSTSITIKQEDATFLLWYASLDQPTEKSVFWS